MKPYMTLEDNIRDMNLIARVCIGKITLLKWTTCPVVKKHDFTHWLFRQFKKYL